jgi:hypothetical protein
MGTMNARRLLLPALAVAVAGCATPTPEGRPTVAATAAPVEAVTVPQPARAAASAPARAAPTVDAASQPAVAAAVADFAASAGVAPADVQVVAVEAVTWPDSSLGCGEPGQSYLQVLTPGYRVTLAAGEERATYHTSDGSAGPVRAVRCGGAAAQRLNLALLSAGALDKARRDLAKRLGGEPEITLAGNAVAGVTQLVCDGTPVTPRPEAPGYVVFEFHLAANGTQYQYRAAGDRILYCGPYSPPQVDEHGNPTQ